MSGRRWIGVALGMLDIAGIGAFAEWGDQVQRVGAHNAELSILFILTVLATYFLFAEPKRQHPK